MRFYIINIYNAISNPHLSPLLNRRVDDKCDYYLRALAAVKHVRTKTQSGALTLEIGCRNKLLMSGREVSEMANAMLAIAKLSIDGQYVTYM